MPPRLKLCFPKYIAHRPRTQPRRRPTQLGFITQCRTFVDENKAVKERLTTHPISVKDEPKGPNMDQLPHVSEEAAVTSQITGGTGPDMNQGTPVTEVAKGDKEAEKSLPKVMKDSMKMNSEQQQTPKGSRSFSTFLDRQTAEVFNSESHVIPSRDGKEMENVEGIYTTAELDNVTQDTGQPDSFAEDLQDEFSIDVIQRPRQVPQPSGHKFPLPAMPLPPRSHQKHRYDPVVEQITKLLMRDGKLSVAQRNMSEILTHLRTSPAPHPSPSHPLLPNSPPPSHLPLHPTLYLSLAIDSLAPLLRIRAMRGAAGGGAALQIPAPLNLRQRRRQAFMWILDAVDKRKGGTSNFAKRVAEELISVVEGRSAAWTRRDGVHRVSITARANLGYRKQRRRG